MRGDAIARSKYRLRWRGLDDRSLGMWMLAIGAVIDMKSCKTPCGERQDAVGIRRICGVLEATNAAGEKRRIELTCFQLTATVMSSKGPRTAHSRKSHIATHQVSRIGRSLVKTHLKQ